MMTCPVCATTLPASGWNCFRCGFFPTHQEGIPVLAPKVAVGDPGYDPAYFEELFRLESGNFWFCHRNRVILQALVRTSPPGKFLEIGCGTGFVISALQAAYPAAACTAGDIFVSGLATAARRLQGITLLQLDARRLPYAEEFDGIGAFDVLEHVEDDRGVLVSIRQALRIGGFVILTVPQHPWLWSEVDVQACHVRRYTRQGLEALLRETGFSVKYSTSFVTGLLPVMWLSRLRKRHGCRKVDPLDELRLPPWLNRMFAGVLRIEAALLSAGLRFPVGGSLLVLARRTQ